MSERKRGYYICSQSGERIEDLDSYDHVCDEWKYWNMNVHLNEKGEPDWNPNLGRRSCRSCRFAEWQR